MKRALALTSVVVVGEALGCSAVVNPNVDRLGGADAGPAGAVDAPVVGGCATGLIECGGRCLDPSSDPIACGGCGIACPPGATCASGTCVCATGTCGCPPGTTDCGAGCVDLAANPLHCGACGDACGVGESCAGGACACAPGLDSCPAGCVDLMTDPTNCGACGTGCAGGGCSGGACGCTPPLVDAGGFCVDVTRDPENCGAPGNTCNADGYCVAGACVCRPPTVPGRFGGCVDPASSPDACGPAGTSCFGTRWLCAGGTCVSACPGGTERCDRSCVDLDTDPRHCGACWDSCGVDQVCSNGSCRDFRAGAGCTSCPCAACGGDLPSCCAYPGTRDTICVDGDCP